jgi:branched-chain amino acid aminotransferase
MVILYHGKMPLHILFSQGLHYASAVFEGERAYNGKIFKSEEHTKRFFKSAEIIGIKIPYSEDELNFCKKRAN